MTMGFVRNLKPITLTDAYCASAVTQLLRHIFWLAGWAETLDADPAWAAVVAVDEPGTTPGNGFRVSSASPRVVHDPLGRFTALMVTNAYVLFLKGTAPRNLGAYRIVEFIDAYNVKIDDRSAPGDGWTTQVDIPARIVGGDGAAVTFNTAGGRLAAARGFYAQAPTGNLKARVHHQTTGIMQVFALPNGITQVGTGATLVGNTDNNLRLNAVFDGNNLLAYLLADNADTQSAFFMWGGLEDVDAADVNPGFVQNDRDLTTDWPWNYATNMLDGAGASIAVYGTFLKRRFDTVATAANYALAGFRLIGSGRGSAALRKCRIVMENTLTVGACVRGKLPLVRHTWGSYEKFRPMDPEGAWLHLAFGLVVPRNGPNDPLPLFY